jgi:hypothetical protein
MSLADRSSPVAEGGHSIDMPGTQAPQSRSELAVSAQPPAFDEPIFEKFDDIDSHVPELPPKSLLRASRFLDNHGLKLGSVVEPAELGQATTPHDVYLSSEEEASSDADDYSDFDYDSSVEDLTSPTRQAGHEDTARVVSVVFSGRPSIVNLPASRKRPVSGVSLGTTETRSSIDSAVSAKPSTTASTTTEDRPGTPASSRSSRPPSNNSRSPNRKSMLLSEILVKKKPPFLNIDPYANSTLDVPKALDSLESEHLAKTPRTPTLLLKGVARSFSLMRKRSRPTMNADAPPAPKLNLALDSEKAKASQDLIQSVATVGVEHTPNEEAGQEQHLLQPQNPEQQPMTPLTPITYNDILRAVKKNAIMMSPPQSDILSPTSPSQAAQKKGILGGLSARRRSIKFTGRA